MKQDSSRNIQSSWQTRIRCRFRESLSFLIDLFWFSDFPSFFMFLYRYLVLIRSFCQFRLFNYSRFLTSFFYLLKKKKKKNSLLIALILLSLSLSIQHPTELRIRGWRRFTLLYLPASQRLVSPNLQNVSCQIFNHATVIHSTLFFFI